MPTSIPGVLSVAGALVLAVSAAAQADHQDADKRLVSWDDLLGSDSKLRLYGFLRVDAQWSDSRFNDPQVPGYVQSEDPTAPASIGAADNDGDFTLHARQTRLGLDFDGPRIQGLGDPEIGGTIEIDFYNSGLGDADSRSAIRMRKGYLQLDWEHSRLLAGQDWDFISPLQPAVNHDMVMWGAGNLGDRRPQVRFERDVDLGDGTLRFAGGIGLAGAVAGGTVENGLRSGENAELPMLAARVGWHGRTAAGGAYQVGVWGHYSEDDYDPTGGTNERDFESWSLGADVRVPLAADRVWALGEVWVGDNLDDVRGGIFQGVNPNTLQVIGSRGGFAELGWQADPHVTLHAGFSIDDPRNSDLSGGMRSENRVLYGAARFRYDALRFGVEYLYWVTDYVGFDEGDSHRIVGFAAYYF